MKKLLLKVPTVSFRVLYGIIAIGLIFFLAYILGGYSYLVKGAMGTDSVNAFSMLSWIDKYFPKVPFWFPQAGGGMSITRSYPVFSLFIVSALKRITNLELLQAMRVVGYSSIISMAVGIYLFVSLRFKNQTAALVASVFYLISPLAWTWLIDWGFYAEAVSHAFVMPAIIFWDYFFTSFLKEISWKTRVYLFLTVIFSSLAFLAHFGAGLGLIAFFIFYLVGYTIKPPALQRKKIFIRGSIAVFLAGLLMVLATLFVSYPFYRYTKITSVAGLQGGLSFENLKGSELQSDAILGFRVLTKRDFLFAARNISFPAVVSAFVLLGVLTSFRSPRLLTFALFTIYAIFLSTNARFYFWIIRHVPLSLGAMFGWRYTSISLRAMVPILASLGIVGVVSLPLFWVKNKYLKFLKRIVVATIVLFIFSFSLYQFGKYPRPREMPYKFGAKELDPTNIWKDRQKHDLCNEVYESVFIGDSLDDMKAKFPEYEKWCYSAINNYFVAQSISEMCKRDEAKSAELAKLCEVDSLTVEEARILWKKCQINGDNLDFCQSNRFLPLEEQLNPKNWPEFTIAGRSKPIFYSEFYKALEKVSKDNPNARIDFSPWVSSFSMASPYFNLDRNLSQIHSYNTNSILNLRFQGQQSIAFYIDDGRSENSTVSIDNLARWFGINYIFVNSLTSPEVFQNGNWEVFDGGWEGGVFKFKEKNGLTEFTDKPSVLVITRSDTDAYDQFFRLGSFGMLPYEKALIVWGDRKVDDYLLRELQNFDALVLYGYTYSDFNKTDKLLTQYVENGGSVFIDTGWQFTVPDWETEETLQIIPFNSLSWTSLGKTSDFTIENSDLFGKVDVSGFSPLIYDDGPWGVSTSDRGNLRGSTKVLLSAKDSPLVAQSEVGKGKVIWSGMNIFSHASYGDTSNPDEIKFLEKIFSYLLDDISGKDYAVSFVRDNPDRVGFSVEENVPTGGFLLWKEAYHPDFRATLVTNHTLGLSSSRRQSPITLPIYRAGPNWVLIKVPKVGSGDKIIYQYKKPTSEVAAKVVSIGTLIFLLGLVIEGVRGEKSLFVRAVERLEKRLAGILFGFWKKPVSWMGKDTEEDDY